MKQKWPAIVIAVAVLLIVGLALASAPHLASRTAATPSPSASPNPSTSMPPQSSRPPSGNGTVSGTVTVGPTSPVCREGQPCGGPGANLAVQVTRTTGEPVGSTKTGSDGKYTLSLPAGTYTLTVKNALYAKSASITLHPAENLTQDFTLDTGIR